VIYHQVKLAKIPPPTVRNLIYHVYPSRENEDWRSNVRQICRRWALFNGRRIVAIATSPQTHRAPAVEREFGSCRAEFVQLKNDPHLREVASFRRLLAAVANTHAGEVTFYAHSKGNTTAETGDKGMSVEDRCRGSVRWRNTMYHYLLDRWPAVAEALTESAAVGTTKMVGAFVYPSGLMFGPGFWMFAGTFFWFRHDVVFSIPTWGNIKQDRYGAEAWLGALLPWQTTHSIYQPWPLGTFPPGSPYNPDYYPEEFERDGP